MSTLDQLSHHAAVHSLASQLTIADLGDGQLAQGVMVLQDQYCLWSSLSQQNTASLYRLACTALVPASQGPSIGKRLASATASLRYSLNACNTHKHCISIQRFCACFFLVPLPLPASLQHFICVTHAAQPIWLTWLYPLIAAVCKTTVSIPTIPLLTTSIPSVYISTVFILNVPAPPKVTIRLGAWKQGHRRAVYLTGC